MKKLTLSMTVAAVLILTASYGFASHGGYGKGAYDGKQCEWSKKGHACKKDLSEKFFQKGHRMLSYEEELGLSPEQVQGIKDLMLSVKKKNIRHDASIDVLALDIKSQLYGYPIDVEATNALIDQKYDAKKAKTKALVGALAELKSTLTADQYAKLKELYKK